MSHFEEEGLPFDASDALLVSMLFAMECIALLGLGLVAPQ